MCVCVCVCRLNIFLGQSRWYHNVHLFFPSFLNVPSPNQQPPWQLHTYIYTTLFVLGALMGVLVHSGQVFGAFKPEQFLLNLSSIWLKAPPSSTVQYPLLTCNFAKKVSHNPSLVIYFFSNPTHKTKSKLGVHIGGRPLIATHLDQSL